eukprot:gene5882-4201_t
MTTRSLDPASGLRVDARRVTFQYPENRTPSLVGVTLQLKPRDRVLVIGANGSGKSTLLTLLAGQRMPQGDGMVRVMGVDPFHVTGMAQHIALIGSPWPPEAVFGNTVERVASPAVDPPRRSAIADSLHLRLHRMVDKMSSGEKRRVQVLHGLLPKATLFLLDECSTDIDVVERKTVLEMVKREVLERDGCCLYATHVFDGVEEWATHVALMRRGHLIQFLTVDEIRAQMQEAEAAGKHSAVAGDYTLEAYARQFMSVDESQAATPFHPTQATFLATAYDGSYLASLGLEGQQQQQQRHTATSDLSCATGVNYWKCPPPTGVTPGAAASNGPVAAIECTHLTYKEIFRDMSFSLPQGSRTLLCGCNGSGKSTLLNMLGGKKFFPNDDGALRILGWKCYDDMRHLNGLVSYGGDWWAKAPDGEVYVREIMEINTPRAHHLQELLAVDLNWDVRKISSGECKRVQLLLHLVEDKPIVLLDEATADLDVDQRHRLLHFLYAESVQRGVTVVYATHIFNGLEGWASKVMVVDRTKRGVHGIWDSPTAVRHRSDKLVSAEGEMLQVRQIPTILAQLKAKEEY